MWFTPYSRADVVSLHMPLNAHIRRVIDDERLAVMKPDAILVNSSRGPVIDEAALIVLDPAALGDRPLSRPESRRTMGP